MSLKSRIFLILMTLTSMQCTILEKCKSEGQRIPDSIDPSKFYLCHHYSKANNWHSYPFHCNKGLRFDPISQDCTSTGKRENSGTGTPISNVPIFNGIARLIRSVSGFPSSKEGDTQNSDIILSLASSIRSLAATVEKLATIQFQKSGPCLAPPAPAPTTTTTSRPVQEIKLERLPIYEIFKPVITVGDDDRPESYEHTIVQVPVPDVDSTKRLNVNATEQNQIQQVQSTASTNVQSTTSTNVQSTTSTNVQSTTSTNAQSTTTTNAQSKTSTNVHSKTSTNPQSKTSTNVEPVTPSTSAPVLSSTAAVPSTSAKPVTMTKITEEDYSASEEHSAIQQNPAYPPPGNNLFDFLFTNIFKRPHYTHSQRRPIPHGNIHKNRLPSHFLDHQFESTTARNIFLTPIHHRDTQRLPIRIPVLQHTNSPHNAFPAVEQHQLPNGGKLVNLVSLFNHLSGIGTPVSPIAHEQLEDSDHYIVPVPVPNETVKPVKTSTTPVSHIETSTSSSSTQKRDSTKNINDIPEGTEEDANNSSRLNDRKPRM